MLNNEPNPILAYWHEWGKPRKNDTDLSILKHTSSKHGILLGCKSNFYIFKNHATSFHL